MRALIIAALALASSAAWATLPAEYLWVSEDRSLIVEFVDDGSIAVMRGGQTEHCRIQNWPISSPQAEIRCTEGATYVFSLEGEDAMNFDGTQLLKARYNVETGEIIAAE